jgi:hypothetical protein
MSMEKPIVKVVVDTQEGLKVQVQIGPRRFEEDLSGSVAAASNYVVMNEELAGNDGRFAVWAMLEVTARRLFDDAQADAERLDAQLYERYWGELSDVAASARGTLVKSRVTQDQTMIDMRLRVREAKEQLDTVSAGRKTIEKRGDYLIEVARNFRQEMQQRLSVNIKRGE